MHSIDCALYTGLCSCPLHTKAEDIGQLHREGTLHFLHPGMELSLFSLFLLWSLTVSLPLTLSLYLFQSPSQSHELQVGSEMQLDLTCF